MGKRGPKAQGDARIVDMTEEELIAVTERIKDQTSPFADDPLKPAEAKIFNTDDGRQIKQYGDFGKPANVGSAPTLKAFARIKHTKKGWIKMTNKEALEYQKEGILAGHDSDEGLGLLKIGDDDNG